MAARGCLPVWLAGYVCIHVCRFVYNNNIIIIVILIIVCMTLYVWDIYIYHMCVCTGLVTRATMCAYSSGKWRHGALVSTTSVLSLAK